MKTFAFLSFLLFAILAPGKYHRGSKIVAVTNAVDTDFISRKFGRNYYHAVYIDHKKDTGRYRLLKDSKMDKDDADLYADNLKSLNHFVHHLKKFNIEGLNRNWLPLYLHKGKYYVYFPSEWGEVGKRLFTDSTMIDWTIEGPYPTVITSFKRPDKNLWEVSVRNYFDGKPRTRRMLIHLIGGERKMAIWEYPDEKGENRYELFIPMGDAPKYDMVVNYCEQSKMAEFMFDKIDFEKLLKTGDH